MKKTKLIDPAKAAEYDRALADLSMSRESAKTILDLSGDTQFLLVVDHPHEESMTVAVHMTTQGMHLAVRNILQELIDADNFPPMPAALRAMGVDAELARRIVVFTTVAAEIGMTPDDLDIIAGILKRSEQMRGPSSIEA